MQNMLAMEFVLNIDELIYLCCAPVAVKGVLAKLKPIKAGQVTHLWKGLDVHAFSSLLVVIVLVVTYSSAMLFPQTSQLKLGRDALCAGDLDFAYTVNAGGVPFWAATDTQGPRLGNHAKWPASVLSEHAHKLRTLIGPIRGDTGDCSSAQCFQGMRFESLNDTKAATWIDTKQDSCCLGWQTRVPSVSSGRFSVRVFDADDTGKSMRLGNPSCRNVLLRPATRSVEGSFYDDNQNSDAVNLFRMAMGDAVDNSACGGCPLERSLCLPNKTCAVPTCELVDEMKICHEQDQTGKVARQFCPITCGCHRAASPLVLDQPESGCPPGCAESEEFAQSLTEIQEQCSDFSHTEGPFRQYLDKTLLLTAEWPSSLKALAASTLPAFQAYGCPMVQSIRSASTFNFCVEHGALCSLNIQGKDGTLTLTRYLPVISSHA